MGQGQDRTGSLSGYHLYPSPMKLGGRRRTPECLRVCYIVVLSQWKGRRKHHCVQGLAELSGTA